LASHFLMCKPLAYYYYYYCYYHHHQKCSFCPPWKHLKGNWLSAGLKHYCNFHSLYSQSHWLQEGHSSDFEETVQPRKSCTEEVVKWGSMVLSTNISCSQPSCRWVTTFPFHGTLLGLPFNLSIQYALYSPVRPPFRLYVIGKSSYQGMLLLSTSYQQIHLSKCWVHSSFPDVGRCIRHRNDYGAILLLGMEFHQDFLLNDRCKVLCPMFLDNHRIVH
jgi:hypothetical protein